MISFKKKHPKKPDDKTYIVDQHKKDQKQSKKELKSSSDFRPECKISQIPLLEPNYPYTFCTLQMDIVEVDWWKCKHFGSNGFWKSLLFPYNTKEIKPIKLSEVYKRIRQKNREQPESKSNNIYDCNNMKVSLDLFEDKTYILPKENSVCKSNSIFKENDNTSSGSYYKGSKKCSGKRKKNVYSQTHSCYNLENILNLDLKEHKPITSLHSDFLGVPYEKEKSHDISTSLAENNIQEPLIKNTSSYFNNENTAAVASDFLGFPNEKVKSHDISASLAEKKNDYSQTQSCYNLEKILNLDLNEPKSIKPQQSDFLGVPYEKVKSHDISTSLAENNIQEPLNLNTSSYCNNENTAAEKSPAKLLTFSNELVPHSEDCSDNKEQSSSQNSYNNLDLKENKLLQCDSLGYSYEKVKSHNISVSLFENNITPSLNNTLSSFNNENITVTENSASLVGKLTTLTHSKEQVPHSESGSDNKSQTCSVENEDKKHTCSNCNVKSDSTKYNLSDKEIGGTYLLELVKKLENLVGITNRNIGEVLNFIKTSKCSNVKEQVPYSESGIYNSNQSVTLFSKSQNVDEKHPYSNSNVKSDQPKSVSGKELEDLESVRKKVKLEDIFIGNLRKVSSFTEMPTYSRVKYDSFKSLDFNRNLINKEDNPLEERHYDLNAEPSYYITHKRMDLPLNNLSATRSETFQNEEITLKVSDVLNEMESNERVADVKPMKSIHKKMDLPLDDIITAKSEAFHTQKGKKIAIVVSEILKDMESNDEDEDILFINFKEYVRL